MPASRPGFLAIPDPYPSVRDVDLQLAARAVAQDAARPVSRGQTLGQFLDGDGRRRGLQFLRRASAAERRRGNVQARVLGPNPLVAMHVRDENLASVVQRPEKGRFLAVTGVDAHMRELHPRSRARRTMSSACWLFEVVSRAASGTPARSQRSGSWIQRSGK